MLRRLNKFNLLENIQIFINHESIYNLSNCRWVPLYLNSSYISNLYKRASSKKLLGLKMPGLSIQLWEIWKKSINNFILHCNQHKAISAINRSWNSCNRDLYRQIEITSHKERYFGMDINSSVMATCYGV